MEREMTTMTDQLLDAAACDAVGALTPVESAAYQADLAAAGEPARVVDRELRETAARLAAASPHLAPPPELRGRILQATAPTTFRMEDYRRKTREDYRFYKWGFYAAACFLIAAALYNIQTRRGLDQANAQMAALTQQQQKLAAAIQDRNEALTAFVRYPDQIRFKNAQGQTLAGGVVDPVTKKAFMFMPQEMLPQGGRPALTLQGVAYDTKVFTAPAVEFFGTREPPAVNLADFMNVKQTAPDETIRPQVAGQHP
jgi:hypothetical protein